MPKRMYERVWKAKAKKGLGNTLPCSVYRGSRACFHVIIASNFSRALEGEKRRRGKRKLGVHSHELTRTLRAAGVTSLGRRRAWKRWETACGVETWCRERRGDAVTLRASATPRARSPRLFTLRQRAKCVRALARPFSLRTCLLRQ